MPKAREKKLTTKEINQQENQRFQNNGVHRRPWERNRSFSAGQGESMTQQHHAEATDINNIIKRFDRTGQLPMGINRGPGQYLDVTKFSHKDPMELEATMQDLRDRHSENLEAEKEAEKQTALDDESKAAAPAAPPAAPPSEQQDENKTSA